jgi:hypothetical protein
LEEVVNAVENEKFFTRTDFDSFITFDYRKSRYPMLDYRRVFQDPNTATDEHTKRKWQIYRSAVLSLNFKTLQTASNTQLNFHKQ